ncbi:MAG TPA: response regulator, partial [Clostridia bacterium]|nr:response regulator [Clostridia bacterium]
MLLPWADYGLAIDQAYTDPLAAYEAIVAHPPDVVFADIRMPEMSGIDLLRAVKARGLHPVFCMVSGYAEFDFVQEALRLGAFGYLTKPVELDSIHKTFGELQKRLVLERIAR